MGDIFFALLTQPMLNALTFFYHIIPDLGIGIIILTLIIKIILFPLNWKSIKAQKEMKGIQEKVNEIKAKITDKEKQAVEVMNLYKQEKINPFSSCLPLILQLVILIALINVFTHVMDPKFDMKSILYPFIEYIKFNNIAFGFLDLSKKATDNLQSITGIAGIILAVVAGAAQYYQTKMMTPSITPSNTNPNDKEAQLTSALNKQMLYVFPVLTIWMGLYFAIGITLYWVVSTAFSIVQQVIILNMHEQADKKNGSGDKKIIEIQKSN